MTLNLDRQPAHVVEDGVSRFAGFSSQAFQHPGPCNSLLENIERKLRSRVGNEGSFE